MKELRTHYLGADEAFTKLALLDSQIEMLSRIQPEPRTKAHRLKITMSFLGLSALLLAVGSGLH